jgi:hypothetical protein
VTHRRVQPAFRGTRLRLSGRCFRTVTSGAFGASVPSPHRGAPADRGVFQRLAEPADVVISNVEPGTIDALGLGTRRPRRSTPGVSTRPVRCSGRSVATPSARAPIIGRGRRRIDQRDWDRRRRAEHDRRSLSSLTW